MGPSASRPRLPPAWCLLAAAWAHAAPPAQAPLSLCDSLGYLAVNASAAAAARPFHRPRRRAAGAARSTHARPASVAAPCDAAHGGAPGVGRGCLAFFVHVAKTGGTSFSAELAHVFGEMRQRGRSASHEALGSGAKTTAAPRVDGVRYAWIEGTSEKKGRPAVDERARAADVVSAERDATWRPFGRRPTSLLTMLRRPSCRAVSHFYHHRDLKRRIPRSFKTLDAFLSACCATGTPEATACAWPARRGEAVDCRQFRNFMTFMLLGRGEASGEWTQTVAPPGRNRAAARADCAVRTPGGAVLNFRADGGDRAAFEARVVDAALARLRAFAFVGLTEHFRDSLCLFYFTYNLTRPFDDGCRAEGTSAPDKNRRAPPDHGDRDVDCPDHGPLVADGTRLDNLLYDAAKALFWARVADMSRRTGFRPHERY